MKVIAGSNNKVTLEPMGFQPLSAAPLATDWRYDSEAVLVTTKDGKVTEYALPQNTDTHHTFELKLDSRNLHINQNLQWAAS